MNTLPRFVAMALFVLMAALVVLLSVPVWRGMRADSAGLAPGKAAESPPLHAKPVRALVLSQRLALGLAAVGLALTLVLSIAIRPLRPVGSSAPFSAARQEIGTLARLVETSVAQGEALSRERDVRRRAEEDAQLKQQLLTQSVDEKIRLGRDLHDGIIQSLYAAGLTLESVRPLVKSDPEEADRRLEQTRKSLNDAIRDVRNYIVGLAPERLRRARFSHALQALIAELSAGRQADFEIKIDDDAASLLTPDQTLEALQIAREAISNSLRHGAATRVVVRMHTSDREVCLLVQDNGTGFNPTQGRDGGHGLGNMRARAERLGASLRVTSTPGEGSRVLATLPIMQSPVT